MNQIISSTLKADHSDMSDALGWFDISSEDRSRVTALGDIVRQNVDAILEDFYERAGGFDHPTRSLSDGNHLSRIREEQKRHFLELVDEALNASYFETRREAGIFNEESGVSPSFYIGVYAYFLGRITEIVDKTFDDKNEAMATVRSLHRVASCHKAMTLEAFAKAREEAIAFRDREFSELPTPVLKLREGLLLVPVVGTLDSHRARLLTARMLDAIRDMQARAVVLDITGVAAVDSAVANHLMQSMSAARLMGAYCVLTGISAEVAQALVKIGVTGEALNPAGDLQRGIKSAEELLEG